ncbi:hypothetical protein Y032_0004g2021 [Ancylostoma ceylanicum]|uniref:Uncharacterized protein n=1 Tax=Ancylostoma ceylanicum TaxID=53326 RepID=A0A016VUD6_9BILA|nr:hypothetical protein Y032_0004g2021 [Ancylostoma ceylanicum]
MQIAPDYLLRARAVLHDICPVGLGLRNGHGNVQTVATIRHVGRLRYGHGNAMGNGNVREVNILHGERMYIHSSMA